MAPTNGMRQPMLCSKLSRMAIVEDELRRLRFGLDAGDKREHPFLVRVRFLADNPVQVIVNARTVLAIVVEQTGDWPAFERWPQLLPDWFLQRSAPESEPDESFDVEAWMRRWRAMTPEQKAAESEGPWTLSDWLYCFDPTEDGMGSDRSWWWWDAGAEEQGSGWVRVATTGWPFGSGSLRCLIEASGGRDVVYGA